MLGLLALATAITSNWMVTEKTSQLDGAHSYSALLPADAAVADIIDNPQKPVLGIDCDKTRLLASLDWPDFIRPSTLSDSLVLVSWKFDDGPVQKGAWDVGDRIVALKGRAAQKWLHDLGGAKRLVVSVPDHHGGQETIFTLDGIVDVEAKVQGMACR